MSITGTINTTNQVIGTINKQTNIIGEVDNKSGKTYVFNQMTDSPIWVNKYDSNKFLAVAIVNKNTDN